MKQKKQLQNQTWKMVKTCMKNCKEVASSNFAKIYWTGLMEQWEEVERPRTFEKMITQLKALYDGCTRFIDDFAEENPEKAEAVRAISAALLGLRLRLITLGGAW